MKSLLLASVLVTAVAMGLTATTNTHVSKPGVPAVDSNYPKAWISLFDPPYENCPEIIMSIGCTTDNTCFVPGGSNGVGFGIYRFDGKVNGNFYALQEQGGSPLNFDLFIGVGGTATNPKGVVGGASLDNGLLYFVNATTLAPTNLTISEEQQISATTSGEHLITLDGFVEKWPQVVLESSNAGKTFEGVALHGNPINKTCTLPEFQAFGDDNTWYFVGGSFPGENENCNSGGGGGGGSVNAKKVLKKISKRFAWIKDGATTEQVEALGYKVSKKNPRLAMRSGADYLKAAQRKQKCHQDGPNCGFSAAVFKTADRGQTWSTHDFNASYWSPDGIACQDANTCVLIGSGNGMFPGSRILRTTNGGSSWEETLFLPSEGGEEIWDLASIAWNPANTNEVWVGGGVENPAGNFAVFFYSMDAGKTWKRSTEVTFVVMVTGLAFTQEGNGYATGITQFQDSTIMRYTADGFPQTPAPVYNGNFTQIQCDDAACSVNCTYLHLPQNQCLTLNGGGPFGNASAIAKCDIANRVLIQDQFILDATCSGPAEAFPQALNTCFNLTNQGGGSFKNVCAEVNGPAAHQSAVFKSVKPIRKI